MSPEVSLRGKNVVGKNVRTLRTIFGLSEESDSEDFNIPDSIGTIKTDRVEEPFLKWDGRTPHGKESSFSPQTSIPLESHYEPNNGLYLHQKNHNRHGDGQKDGQKEQEM